MAITPRCPYCASADIAPYLIIGGVVVLYKCNACGRLFKTPLTLTAVQDAAVVAAEEME